MSQVIRRYVLYRNRKCLYETEKMSHAEKEKQYKMQKQFGSIYGHYIPECYYYDILDLFRRLLLTGGLIMMGEESAAQEFMGIVICAGWLSLLIHKKPYEAMIDNILAIILAAHLLLSLVAGMALKLYALTPEQDVYQREGFGIVLLTVTILCVVLGILSILAETLCIREKVLRILQVTVSKNEPKDKSESDNFTFFEKNDERNSSSPYKVHTESTRKIHSFQGSTNNYYSNDEKAEEQDDVEEVDVEKNKNNFHFD